MKKEYIKPETREIIYTTNIIMGSSLNVKEEFGSDQWSKQNSSWEDEDD